MKLQRARALLYSTWARGLMIMFCCFLPSPKVCPGHHHHHHHHHELYHCCPYPQSSPPITIICLFPTRSPSLACWLTVTINPLRRSRTQLDTQHPPPVHQRKRQHTPRPFRLYARPFQPRLSPSGARYPPPRRSPEPRRRPLQLRYRLGRRETRCAAVADSRTPPS